MEKWTKAPFFDGKDINDKEISLKEHFGHNTILLFSDTNCGYSKKVTDHISQADFKLGNDTQLINFLGSNSKERTIKYFERYEVEYPIIADRKDIETDYGISGYPILYLVNEKGTITESLAGSADIIDFLDNLKLK
ncbi:peroxiredoxin family protein [Chondrinema litorale]|uniref:peroxiredoxin family protein n=1 Tax=Chondrinema litorale TaxID=2994555 RepID=UPI002543B79E|nr:TlpA disulfide reductase family protein [Chondrinema litorale]UZR96331.1 TlpA disulfide reductase family protein [Chondrinema litorale]